MSNTPEQLARRARDAVSRMLAALEEGGLVARFVDRYVAEHHRPELKASTLRYRELVATITRESLLAMVTQMEAGLRRFLARRNQNILRGVRAEAADIFREEFFASLTERMNWTPADLEEFRRDVNLYTQLEARASRPTKARRATPSEGPFADRCALLLDPSLLDKARESAGRYLLDLGRVTEKILRDIFRSRRKP